MIPKRLPQGKQRLSDPAGMAIELLTERELAQRWKISVKTLQNSRWRGSSLPLLRIGRAVRYRLSDIMEFEHAHLRTSTSDDLRSGGI